MCQVGSIINVIDNSGAKTVKCIKVFGGFKKRQAKLGQYVAVVIKQIKVQTSSRTIIETKEEAEDEKEDKIRRGEKFYGLVVQTKKTPKTKLGFYTMFLTTSIVLLNKNQMLLGTRIFGVIPKQLRATRYMRLITLAAGTC